MINDSIYAMSPEELLRAAREKGLKNITEGEIASYYSALHKSGELSDEELDTASGGCACHEINGTAIVNERTPCKASPSQWRCFSCGLPENACKCKDHIRQPLKMDFKACEQGTGSCGSCMYASENEYSLLVCKNPTVNSMAD